MTTTDGADRIPNGVARAAILAAGVGGFAFGGFVDLAEASKRCSRLLDFYDPVGDLSGKSALAVVVWLLAWIILHLRWRNSNLQSAGKITAWTIALVLV